MISTDCAIHNTREEAEEPYLICFECKHMYKTAQELIDEFNSMLMQIAGKAPFHLPVVIKVKFISVATDATHCPICLHDWVLDAPR